MSPWDALLREVRRSSYRAEWIDQHVDDDGEKLFKLEQQGAPEPSDGGDGGAVGAYYMSVSMLQGNVKGWLSESRKERSHLAKISKAAIDAGLAERYVQGVESEARLIAKVLSKAMEAAELTPDQHEKASKAFREALREVSTELNDRHSALQIPASV